MSLRKLKQIDDITKLTTSGYIRQFKTENNSFSIPIMIQYIVMLYYWINEKFTVHGKDIEVENDGDLQEILQHMIQFMVITWTSIKCYQWAFKIISMSRASGSGGPILIGIDASENKYDSNDLLLG